MIELVPALPRNCLGFIAKGEVTKSDYKDVVDPAIEQALQSTEKLSILYVLGDDVSSVDLSAMIEDAKTAHAYYDRIDKLALVTDKPQMKTAMKAMSHFMDKDVRVFSTKEEAVASEWLTH
ncbi:MAG: STAS/SEC14 domain-containing protein [Polyangiaceae bacterium]|nr:STAS/SEC14 domain-containing protein [Polyangiaceae bacterium]